MKGEDEMMLVEQNTPQIFTYPAHMRGINNGKHGIEYYSSQKCPKHNEAPGTNKQTNKQTNRMNHCLVRGSLLW